MYLGVLDFMKLCFVLLSIIALLYNQLLLGILLMSLFFLPFNSTLCTPFDSMSSHLQNPSMFTPLIFAAQNPCTSHIDTSSPSNTTDLDTTLPSYQPSDITQFLDVLVESVPPIPSSVCIIMTPIDILLKGQLLYFYLNQRLYHVHLLINFFLRQFPLRFLLHIPLTPLFHLLLDILFMILPLFLLLVRKYPSPLSLFPLLMHPTLIVQFICMSLLLYIICRQDLRPNLLLH